MIDIKGIYKPRLLQELYNRSHQQGLGLLDPKGAVDMTIEEATSIVNLCLVHPDKWPLTFDYLNGRVMKVNISGDEMDPFGYDRDNGEGAAESVVDFIREEMEQMQAIDEELPVQSVTPEQQAVVGEDPTPV